MCIISHMLEPHVKAHMQKSRHLERPRIDIAVRIWEASQFVQKRNTQKNGLSWATIR